MKSDLANYRVLGKMLLLHANPIIPNNCHFQHHCYLIKPIRKALEPIHDFQFNSFPSSVVFLANSFVLLVEQDVVLT